MFSFIGFIVTGLIIGLAARLVLPGEQKLSMLWTLLLGLVGSVVGGLLAGLVGAGRVLTFIVAVVVAVAVLAVAERQGRLPRTGTR